MKKKIIFLSVFISALFVLGFKIYDNIDDFELIKNLEIYTNVLKQLKLNYFDEIDSRELITSSIKKMLKDLDPYTVYYSESEIENARVLSFSNNLSTGITVDTFENKFYIVNIIDSSSAFIQGLKIGDEIKKINGIDLQNKNLDNVNEFINGQLNSKITLQINRNNSEFEKNITVANIKSKSVSLVKIVNNIGYIKIDNFLEQTANEFNAALTYVQKNKVRALIIDLRDNPGGLLDQAVSIINNFIPNDKIVVVSKGKSTESNMIYKTNHSPIALDLPLVVIVNHNSASASEIVAGCLQDYDRAVVIGSNSYGKGLVQRIFDVGYNSKIKITISRYFLPSGRCIQAINYAKNNYLNNSKFYTQNGRTVYESNGIYPDVYTNQLDSSNYLKDFISSIFFFDFCNQIYYLNDNNLNDSSLVKIDNALFEKYFYTKYSSLNVEDIIKLNIIKNNNKNNVEISKSIDLLKNQINNSINTEIAKNQNILNFYISRELIKRKFGYYFSNLFVLKNDSEILKAQEILNNKDNYNSILNKN